MSEELQELLSRSSEGAAEAIEGEPAEPRTPEHVRVMEFAVRDQDIGRAVAVRNFLEWICSGSGRGTASNISS